MIKPLLRLTIVSFAMSAPALAAGTYSYEGCQVYNGTAGTPDPIANADISSASVDSESANVITFLSGTGSQNISFSGVSDAALEIVNLATTATVLTTVQHVTGGHTPPITGNSMRGGPGAKAPWDPSFKIEGAATPCTLPDCHAVVLNTDDCLVYQGGGWNFVAAPATLSAYNGFIDDLHESFSDQWPTNKEDNAQESGIPLLMTTLYGEDDSLSSINHPVTVIFPAAAVDSNASHTANYATGFSTDGTCDSTVHHCARYGDIFRLKSGAANCNSFSAGKAALCKLLKQNGMVLADTTEETGTGTTQLRFGLDTSGVDDWGNDSSNPIAWFGGLSISNFDLISRTTLVP